MPELTVGALIEKWRERAELLREEPAAWIQKGAVIANLADELHQALSEERQAQDTLHQAATEFLEAHKLVYDWTITPPGVKSEGMDDLIQARARLEALLEPQGDPNG